LNTAPPGRPHDPLACGLSFDGDCDSCLAHRLKSARLKCNYQEEAAARWEQLCRRFPAMRGGNANGLQELGSPDMSTDQARGLVATLLAPEHRAVLQEVLIDLLAEPMAVLLARLQSVRSMAQRTPRRAAG
jgi:hypothetical protein